MRGQQIFILTEEQHCHETMQVTMIAVQSRSPELFEHIGEPLAALCLI